MTNHRRTKRKCQKGGFWPFTSSDTTYPTQSWGDMFSSWGNKAKESTTGLLTSANQVVGDAATTVSNTANQAITSSGEILNQDVAIVPEQTTNMAPEQSTNLQSVGGRRRRRSRRMKGGKGLTYYASPVSGLKVAEPTTWIGGSRKRKNKGKGKKSRRTRRHKRRY